MARRADDRYNSIVHDSPYPNQQSFRFVSFRFENQKMDPLHSNPTTGRNVPKCQSQLKKLEKPDSRGVGGVCVLRVHALYRTEQTKTVYQKTCFVLSGVSRNEAVSQS